MLARAIKPVVQGFYATVSRDNAAFLPASYSYIPRAVSTTAPASNHSALETDDDILTDRLRSLELAEVSWIYVRA